MGRTLCRRTSGLFKTTLRRVIKMEAITMSEYIIGGLIFAGIFIVPMIIISIIERMKIK